MIKITYLLTIFIFFGITTAHLDNTKQKQQLTDSQIQVFVIKRPLFFPLWKTVCNLFGFTLNLGRPPHLVLDAFPYTDITISSHL